MIKIFKKKFKASPRLSLGYLYIPLGVRNISPEQ